MNDISVSVNFTTLLSFSNLNGVPIEDDNEKFNRLKEAVEKYETLYLIPKEKSNGLIQLFTFNQIQNEDGKYESELITEIKPTSVRLQSNSANNSLSLILKNKFREYEFLVDFKNVSTIMTLLAE